MKNNFLSSVVIKINHSWDFWYQFIIRKSSLDFTSLRRTVFANLSPLPKLLSCTKRRNLSFLLFLSLFIQNDSWRPCEKSVNHSDQVLKTTNNVFLSEKNANFWLQEKMQGVKRSRRVLDSDQQTLVKYFLINLNDNANNRLFNCNIYYIH